MTNEIVNIIPQLQEDEVIEMRFNEQLHALEITFIKSGVKYTAMYVSISTASNCKYDIVTAVIKEIINRAREEKGDRKCISPN
jgi:deoxycytidylate deaminase